MAHGRLFHDRVHAGRELAKALANYREQSPIVLGLPRGGVPVAYEVARVLDRLRRGFSAPAEHPVRMRVNGVELQGDLALPPGAQGIVLFAHGSGSSRKSPRNRFVSRRLQAAGLATLLFDLLTEEEEALDAIDYRLRFDIALLARRLVAATDWVHGQRETRGLRIGYFGASTGAAAALIAAVERADVVAAVVSRGGRPDLADAWLARVRAPTLLIVGGDDWEVLQLNRSALERMQAPRRLDIVPQATHLFEEPGALDRVADAAAEWFRTRLTRAKVAEARP